MCECNVYMKDGDELKLYFDGVDKIIPQDDGLLLVDIFGRKKFVKAKFKELDLVDHRIIIEKKE